MDTSIVKGATTEEDVIIEHTIKDEDEDEELNNLDNWLEEVESEELDNSWVEKYQKIEKNYNKFYKEKSKEITIFFLYINDKNILESLVKTNYPLNDSGKIHKDSLIYLIKNNQYLSKKKYQLISLLKYNLTIEPEDIVDITANSEEYLHSQRYLDDIFFADTINMFQDLNSLFFIFYSKKPSMNTTKKIIINKNRKTKRKKLKADSL